MKGIFISQAVLNKNNGGGQFVRSLTGLLKKAVGNDNLTVVSLPDEYDTSQHFREEKNLVIYEANPSKMQMAVNVLTGCPRYVGRNIFDQVVELIKKGKYDFVFLGFSTYRYLVEQIKKEVKIPVYVMYQGVTPNTKMSRLVNATLLQRIKAYPSFKLVLERERVVANLSDCNIVHNERERNVFYKYYRKEPDMYLPVFIADRFKNMDSFADPGYEGFPLLFIGSKFGPNLSGLKWFVEKVMPYTDQSVHLYVVGQGMEFLRENELYQQDNIHIVGEVEKLEPWYYHASLVVEPIFEGDGMKTKTVEAMMFGKTILGTEEAFCGYVGLESYLCNTAQEFLDEIEKYRVQGVEKINYSVREIYLEKYSEDAVLGEMKRMLEEYVKNR